MDNDKKNGSGRTTGNDATGMDKGDGKAYFNDLVSVYGIDKAVARGLRAKINLPSDERIKEEAFIKALKEFTGQRPR